MTDFGDILRELRSERKLTQKKLAGLAGMQQSALSHLEKGTRRPSSATVEKLADALKVSTDVLLGRASQGNQTSAPSRRIPSSLKAALARLQKDHHSFGAVPLSQASQVDVRAKYQAEWLGDTYARIRSNDYVPSTAPLFDIPRHDWHVRTGQLLSLDDQLTYHYLAMRCLPSVEESLRWSATTVRFSHRIRRAGSRWFRSPVRSWETFERVSRGKARGAEYVVIADVASYYDNISIERLVRELHVAGVPVSDLSLLEACLVRWAGQRGRGIPQTYSPSHVLAEFYINPVDGMLVADGYQHIRYCDDFRVFVSSRGEAVRALQSLTRILRSRGLDIQRAKTRVLHSSQALEKFAIARRMLMHISKAFGLAFRRIPHEGPYTLPADVASFSRTRPLELPRDASDRLQRELGDQELKELGPTELRFLLNRLAELRLPIAVGLALDTLDTRPEETAWCLNYLGAVAASLQDEQVADVARIVTTQDESVCQYQRAQVLAWCVQHRVKDKTLRKFCMSHLSSGSRHFLLPALAAEYLGAVSGSNADFNRLASALDNETNPYHRAAYLYALRCAPPRLFSKLYERVRGEHPVVDWTVRYVEEGHHDDALQ